MDEPLRGPDFSYLIWCDDETEYLGDPTGHFMSILYGVIPEVQSPQGFNNWLN